MSKNISLLLYNPKQNAPLPRRGIGNQNDNLKPESENYATTGFQDEAQTRL